MGCALILSDINGCNEIVNSGKDGWLVPVKDSSALTAAMLEARNNKVLTTKFAAATKSKITTGYAQSYLWDCILKEYHHLMTTKKS
jgi:glycosyltransferase involved in cell wall biosynthesis